MAVMIPDSCPAKASAGEKRLFRLFQDILPDNFKVWYEPDVEGRFPDFLLLADTFGLLVVEVRGWYAKEIRKVGETEVELAITEDNQTHQRTLPNPVKQARDYLGALSQKLAQFAVLCGERPGPLSFPTGCGVLLTNVTREQLQEAGLSDALPPSAVLCRDELTALEEAKNDRDTIRRLKQLFVTDVPFEPLTLDQLRTIQGVFHKEAVVKEVPAQASSVPAEQPLPEGATVLQVLDHRQEQVARSIGDGHRVFFGVAGSGKTVLLLARAKLLAADPNKRILILCYNRVLATYLRACLGGDPSYRSVQVFTFHAWARERTGLVQMPDEAQDDHFRRLERTLLEEAAHWTMNDKYDAVLVDEAHDFKPEWFRCCALALKKGAEGDLLLAVDGAQSLYGRPRAFTWKSVGVNAQGRSQRLDRNYRNTREVLELAWEVTQATRTDTDETEIHVRVRPTEALRSGTVPLYQHCLTAAQEQSAVVQFLRQFREQGMADRDIAVLYPRREWTRVENLVNALRKAGEVCWITDPNNPLMRDRYQGSAGVRVSTIHSAKGLEFSAVILACLDQLPGEMNGDEAANLNLLYVGLTRACDHLALTWVGQSDFTHRIEASARARPYVAPGKLSEPQT